MSPTVVPGANVRWAGSPACGIRSWRCRCAAAIVSSLYRKLLVGRRIGETSVLMWVHRNPAEKLGHVRCLGNSRFVGAAEVVLVRVALSKSGRSTTAIPYSSGVRLGNVAGG